VNKFSKSRTRLYPGFSETNNIRPIRVISVNNLTPDNAEKTSGCKINRMLSSGGLAIRLTRLQPRSTNVRGPRFF